MTAWLNGIPRPDHGDGMVQRACRCGAGWVGLPNDPCPWCLEAVARAVDEERHRLLWPAWMVEKGPRYDRLGAVDRAVWDRTRGLDRGDASERAWVARLADAVTANIVTEAEARDALARARRARNGAAA